MYIFFIFNKKNNLDFVDLSILPVIGYSFIKILPSVQGAFAQYIVVKSNLNSLDEIYKNIIFMKNDKIDENNIVKNKKSNEDKFNDFNNLEIIDLKFGYNGKQIFDGFNFKISKGEKIGIIGPSGSGKSTFLYLITGLLNFERGKYYLNNSLIQNNEILNFIKKSFAIIPQNPTLMEDTILNNILLGQKLDEEKLHKAIKFAELTDFIDKLDDGLNTLIHGTNSNLSGGQIQRISIARAFYRNPKIMIIDEGFNQLDDLNEAKLINKIQDFKDLTVITVYHKISSQMKFDNIYYIENLKLKKKMNNQEIEIVYIDSTAHAQIIKNLPKIFKIKNYLFSDEYLSFAFKSIKSSKTNNFKVLKKNSLIKFLQLFFIILVIKFKKKKLFFFMNVVIYNLIT